MKIGISEVKGRASQQLKGRWKEELKFFGVFFAVVLLISIVSELIGQTLSAMFGLEVSGVIISGGISVVLEICFMVVTMPIIMGYTEHILLVTRRGEDGDIEGVLKYYFKGKGKIKEFFELYVFLLLKIFLYSLMLVVPGILKGLSYSQAYYIKLDNPGMGAKDVLKESEKLMQGYRKEYFLMYLTYIPILFLGVITIVGWIPVVIHMQMATAVYYNELKDRGYQKQGD